MPALALTFAMCSKLDNPIEEDLPEPIIDTLPVVDTTMCSVVFPNYGSKYVDLYVDGEYAISISGSQYWSLDESTIKLKPGIHTFQLHRWKHFWPVEEIVVTKDTTILLQYDDAGIENVRFISDENSKVLVFSNYLYLGSLTDGLLPYGTDVESFSYMAMRESDGAIVRGNVFANDTLTIVPIDFENNNSLIVSKRLWVNSFFANSFTGENYYSNDIFISYGEIEKDGVAWEMVCQGTNMNPCGFIRMSDNKMYWTKDFFEIEEICDWNVEKGDTTMYCADIMEVVDTVVNYVFQDGITRKCILELVVSEYEDSKWEMLVVEGIGSLDGFMGCNQGLYDIGGNLHSYYENGKLVYSRDDYLNIRELFGWAYSL